MTGMKEGAGENPFADDAESEEIESAAQGEEDSNQAPAGSTAESNDANDPQSPKQQRTVQIPYKFRRNGVQDGRNRVPLFLREGTKSGERDALRELEDRFDDSVSLTDLREALVKVGLQHLDEVEDHLEEWGYGMTFNE